ncbi:Tagatose-6-phosphate kinase [Companilactobacillus paralimentarius]
MILTVTMNPSVDTLYELDKLVIDSVNRSSPIKVLGGKGVNAARVASLLGSRTIVTGFLGGYNGKFFHDHLNSLSPNNPMDDQFVTCNGETRNCITIMHDNEKQTQINELGPNVKDNELSSLRNKTKTILKNQFIDIVIISGALPLGLSNDIYYELISFMTELSPKTKIILDTSQSVLKDTLKLCSKNNIFPYSIKPNINELREIADSDSDDIMKLIKESNMDKIPMVIVSKGNQGCFAKIKSKQFVVTVPKIEAVNPTGSGDSTVGALAYALEHGLSDEDILRCSMAAGESNALEEKIGFITQNNYHKYFNKIRVN